MREGQTTTQAHATLRVRRRLILPIRLFVLLMLLGLQGTISKEKHEILFSRFQINYNLVDERYRKGSVLVREVVRVQCTRVFTIVSS